MALCQRLHGYGGPVRLPELVGQFVDEAFRLHSTDLSRRVRCQVRMYSPGPSYSTGYSSLPVGGGFTSGPEFPADHAAQSSHQEPSCRVACWRHSSADSGWFSPMRCHPFGPGGLTMPAICPPLVSTNRTGPDSSPV